MTRAPARTAPAGESSSSPASPRSGPPPEARAKGVAVRQAAAGVYDAKKHCGAPSKRTGAKCLQPKGFRTDHSRSGRCWLHGGSTPNGKRFAEREAAAAKLATLGIPIEIDPISGLRQAVWEAAGNVAFLRQQCQALGVELVGSVRSATRDGDLYEASEEARAMVRLYGEWFDRYVKTCKAAADVGIAEAEIRIAEQQGATFVQVVMAVLGGLKLPADKMTLARSLFAAEFRKVAPSLATAGTN